MYNFNKERWGMVAGGNRLSRLMVEECFKWAMSRMVFGRTHPTLRCVQHTTATGNSH